MAKKRIVERFDVRRKKTFTFDSFLCIRESSLAHNVALTSGYIWFQPWRPGAFHKDLEPLFNQSEVQPKLCLNQP